MPAPRNMPERRYMLPVFNRLRQKVYAGQDDDLLLKEEFQNSRGAWLNQLISDDVLNDIKDPREIEELFFYVIVPILTEQRPNILRNINASLAQGFSEQNETNKLTVLKNILISVLKLDNNIQDAVKQERQLNQQLILDALWTEYKRNQKNKLCIFDYETELQDKNQHFTTGFRQMEANILNRLGMMLYDITHNILQRVLYLGSRGNFRLDVNPISNNKRSREEEKKPNSFEEMNQRVRGHKLST